MKKYPIGFNTNVKEDVEINVPMEVCKGVIEPKKSVVQVFFPHRGMGWAYYNDSFDLKVGDYVYVEGKLEGCRGYVTEVNYNFKIKLSDYKKVIAVVDTNIKGDFYLADSHIVSFDRSAIPYSKILTWFKAPENDEEYVTGSGEDTNSFPLNDLSKMNISKAVADRGFDYYMENRVCYLELDGSRGRGIVEGNENYEVEFEYNDGEISNLRCSCFCSGACKHEFATMLQLKESFEIICKNYEAEYNDYFALMSKNVFLNTVMNKKVSGKISLGV